MLLLLFPCKPCYILCSNYVDFIIELKQLCTMLCTCKLWHWHLFLLARHPCCCYRWSECYCPCAGCCFRHFSELSQLTPPYWFAATWRFVHVHYHYSDIMLKCFLTYNYSHIMLSIIDSSLFHRLE